jgi:tRNA modification GTPase
LLNAETSAQLRLAHKQNESAKRLEPIRTRLIELIARIEAAIDFSEDMETQQNLNWEQDFRKQVDELKQKLDKLLSSTRKGMLIRSGIRVALLGRTNVGKSSLMNLLGKFFFC